MNLPSAFLIDGNDSMEIALHDSREITQSSHSIPSLSFDCVEMDTLSQGDSLSSDMLVNQQTELTEMEVGTIICHHQHLGFHW
jgi:hypothetical protein